MKVVIIGGVAAGMSAASKLRRMDKNAEIVVYEKGGTLSYGACGLPYFISDENPDATLMLAKGKDDFEKLNIQCHLFCEVVKLDSKDKQLLIKDHQSGQLFMDSYDQLVIATGASPVIPPLPNVHLSNIKTLKSYEDGFEIKKILQDPAIKEVVIIGGGYIGVEIAEACRYLGKNTRLIELMPRVLTSFDPEFSSMAQQEMSRQNVALHLGEKVLSFKGDTKVQAVITDQQEYPADFVLMSVGIRPTLDFLKDVPIARSKNGAIVIDREGRTNIHDIFAAGDCAEIYHMAKEENAYIPLGTTANKMGRIVGENLSGKHKKYIGALGSAAIKVFDMDFARTGLNEAEATQLAIEYETVMIKANNHAAYYPNPTPIWMKLLVDKKTKKILGAQGAGKQDVVLRVDMFAIAIQAKMTAEEVGFADLCYAPPFAGVWDVVNIAANAVK